MDAGFDGGWGRGRPARLELHVNIKTHMQPLRIGGHREFRKAQMERRSAADRK